MNATWLNNLKKDKPTPPAPITFTTLPHRPVATGDLGCDPPPPPLKFIWDVPPNLDKEQIGICW